jgi:hypothetical protein
MSNLILPSERARREAALKAASRYELPGKRSGTHIAFGYERGLRWFQYWDKSKRAVIDEKRLSRVEAVALFEKYGAPSKALEKAVDAFMIDIEPSQMGVGKLASLPDRKVQEIAEDLLDSGTSWLVDPGKRHNKQELEDALMDAVRETSYEKSVPHRQRVMTPGREHAEWDAWIDGVSIKVVPDIDLEEVGDSGWSFTLKSRGRLAFGPKKSSEMPSEAGFETAEESMFAKGEDVPLSDLPEELQKNVEDPPPAVEKVKQELEEESMMEKHDQALLPVELVRLAAARRQRLTWSQRQAAGGLYGYTKRTQRDVEATTRKVQKRAETIAKALHRKDAASVAFLKAHSKRAKSASAKLLLHAMRSIGPKVASERQAAQIRQAGLSFDTFSDSELANLAKAGQELQKKWPKDFKTPDVERNLKALDQEIQKRKSKTASERESGDKVARGLYGHPTKTARLALAACADLRSYAGEAAYDLHSRRMAMFDKLTGFMKEHSKTARCGYTKMVLGCYPDGPEGKTAKKKDPPKEHQFTSENNPNPKGSDADGDGKTNEKKPFKSAGVPAEGLNVGDDVVVGDSVFRVAKVSNGIAYVEFKEADFDAGEIGEAEPGPLEHDADEPWMANEFTQQEHDELADLQESGVLPQADLLPIERYGGKIPKGLEKHQFKKKDDKGGDKKDDKKDDDKSEDDKDSGKPWEKKKADFDPKEIGDTELGGALASDPDEAYMKDNFTLQETNELQHKQEDGALNDGKADEEPAPPKKVAQPSTVQGWLDWQE